MGQLLQFQNLHRTKKSEGSTPELFDHQEEEEETEDNPSDPGNIDSGLFTESGAGREGLEEFPVLELQAVPLPSKQTTFSFGEWRHASSWRHHGLSVLMSI